LVTATGGRKECVEVCGPLGERVSARYGLVGERGGIKPGECAAVIEMAEAAGLFLVPEARRNPSLSTTYGVGELILAAAAAGCGEFIIGVGGSATNDCGTGMAQALGVKFRDGQGKEITERMSGGWMGRVGSVDISGLSPTVRGCRFRLACDVGNPLLGPEGATRVYGPQKGADGGMVETLETGMMHAVGLIERAVGRRVRDISGAGAAGGLGAGIMAFLNASVERGIDLVVDYSGLRDKLRGADLLLTGEGQVDGSTAFGKTIQGVAGAAVAEGVPVMVLAGTVGPGARRILERGVTSIFSICSGPMTLEEAMKGGPELVADAAEYVVRAFRGGLGP